MQLESVKCLELKASYPLHLRVMESLSKVRQRNN